MCQLSTNDMKFVDEYLGEVSADEVRDPAAFDRATTIGAIEYIIATAQKEWDCPIFFYTNGWLKEDDRYNTLVDALYKVQEKWDIHIIDMHSDEAFNDLTEEQVKLYMKDDIHPTLAGYKEWWLPVFEEALYSVCH